MQAPRSDGAKIGLGEPSGLVATSAGTNAIKLRGNDTKNQNATSLNLGQATQQQGHNAGGWFDRPQRHRHDHRERRRRAGRRLGTPAPPKGS